METAAKNTDTFNQGIKSEGIRQLQTGDVHKLHVPVKSTSTTNNCYQCGRNGHSSATCRFSTTVEKLDISRKSVGKRHRNNPLSPKVIDQWNA